MRVALRCTQSRTSRAHIPRNASTLRTRISRNSVPDSPATVEPQPFRRSPTDISSVQARMPFPLSANTVRPLLTSCHQLSLKLAIVGTTYRTRSNPAGNLTRVRSLQPYTRARRRCSSSLRAAPAARRTHRCRRSGRNHLRRAHLQIRIRAITAAERLEAKAIRFWR